MITLLFYYRRARMILQKEKHNQSFFHTLEAAPLLLKSPPQVSSPDLVRPTSQVDDSHFNDSHFSNQLRAQDKFKINSVQPTTTYIRKLSHVRMRSNSKEGEYDTFSGESGRMLRQGIINFSNFPVSVPFTAEASYSKGNHHRNYTSCSIRRKTSSVSSVYQSRKQQPSTPESQRISKCAMMNPFTQQEYLHKKKENFDSRHKRFNSIDYSIIKPHEIQAAPFSCRHQYKSKEIDRQKCDELISTIKKKEELLKKHKKLQAERQQIRMKINRQSNSRKNAHTSFLNRRPIAKFEERNQVLPWQVDSNLTDII